MFLQKKKFWKRVLFVFIGSLVLLFGIDFWVASSTKDRLYNDVSIIPHNKVGLLLGTSKYVGNHFVNQYYQYRIDAAVALFKAGKIDYILVSGDNGNENYNEPETFQADLIAAGIPADRIVLDYAGFRTLDSIVRCLHVFGESDITIISQPFHNERALFIADHSGVTAVGFNAKEVSRRYGFKTQLREKAARVKMMLDLASGKQPKFYGKPIKIGS